MFKAASRNHISSALTRIAADIEAGKVSPQDAALRIHRVLMALSQTAQEAIQSMGPIQATSKEDVMKGFKSANPSLTEAQLAEIAEHWDRNKSVIKDKHAAQQEQEKKDQEQQAQEQQQQ